MRTTLLVKSCNEHARLALETKLTVRVGAGETILLRVCHRSLPRAAALGTIQVAGSFLWLAVTVRPGGGASEVEDSPKQAAKQHHFGAKYLHNLGV